MKSRYNPIIGALSSVRPHTGNLIINPLVSTDRHTVEAEHILLTIVDLHGKFGGKIVETNEPYCEVIIMNKL